MHFAYSSVISIRQRAFAFGNKIALTKSQICCGDLCLGSPHWTRHVSVHRGPQGGAQDIYIIILRPELPGKRDL